MRLCRDTPGSPEHRPEARRRDVPGPVRGSALSADPRQGVADQHVHDPGAAERGVEEERRKARRVTLVTVPTIAASGPRGPGAGERRRGLGATKRQLPSLATLRGSKPRISSSPQPRGGRAWLPSSSRSPAGMARSRSTWSPHHPGSGPASSELPPEASTLASACGAVQSRYERGLEVESPRAASTAKPSSAMVPPPYQVPPPGARGEDRRLSPLRRRGVVTKRPSACPDRPPACRPRRPGRPRHRRPAIDSMRSRSSTGKPLLDNECRRKDRGSGSRDGQVVDGPVDRRHPNVPAGKKSEVTTGASVVNASPSATAASTSSSSSGSTVLHEEILDEPPRRLPARAVCKDDETAAARAPHAAIG